VTYDFYSMPIGVEDESGEIVGMVFTIQSGRSVVPAARLKRGCVESEHSASVWRTETHVHALRRFDAWFDSNCKFHSERSWHRTIVRSASFAEVYDSDNPYGTQCGIIEPAAASEISNAKRNVF